MKLKKNYFEGMKGNKTIKKKDGKLYTIREHRSRFFFPDEWMAFYDILKKKQGAYTRQQITFNTLLNTGARISEIRGIEIQDIDLQRSNIVLRKVKRVVNRRGVKKGQRRIRIVPISSKFNKFLRKVIKDYKLKATDKLPIFTTQGANQSMKKNLEKAGIKDYDMFSVHNVRKTSEMWLISLDIDSFKIVKHFGHSREIALKHYLSSDVFTYEEKNQIRELLGDLYVVRGI